MSTLKCLLMRRILAVAHIRVYGAGYISPKCPWLDFRKWGFPKIKGTLSEWGSDKIRNILS